MSERGATQAIASALAVSLVGSAAFGATFVRAAGPQLQGIGLALACFGLMAALLVWVKTLMPSESAARGGAGAIVARHRMLIRGGLAAAGALGVAALFPVRTLGPSPAGRVGQTDWRSGLRLVRADGTPVRSDELALGATITAFPEGCVGSDRLPQMTADAVMLVRVPGDALHLPRERRAWTPQGFIAYSKVCTHAGCPVALYRQGPQQLMCPCHQSTFDVLRGGRVVFGPAARPLPQLPLAIDPDGGIRAAGAMSGVVGPDTWGFG